jgi:hypothetical protein
MIRAGFVDQDIEGDVTRSRPTYFQILHGVIEELIPLFRLYGQLCEHHQCMRKCVFHDYLPFVEAAG